VSPLHAVLDARWIFPEISGIGNYTRQLMRRLPLLAPEMTFTAIFDSPQLLARETGAGAGWTPPPNFAVELVPWRPFSPSGQLGMAARLRDLRADVFHSPNFMLPFPAVAPSGRRPRAVVTIHDLIPLLFPRYTPRARKTRWLPVLRLMMAASVRRASAIVVPSGSTADDVRRTFPRVDPSRIVVTPEAADPMFRPTPQPPSGPPVVLYIGRRDPYKNLPLLVRAFARVHRRIPAARLIVVGPPDPRYPEAEATARETGVEGAIEWKGYVAGDALLALYHGAHVAAFPSLYEGFGLPVLEAMACGVPVVCGNRSSLPEVAGDAALLVPPEDEAAVADAILRVLADPRLAADLRARGLRRAALFSWEETARRTLAAYRRAVDLPADEPQTAPACDGT